MANKFRVNQLLLSGQTVTANSNSLYVNGSEIQGGSTNIEGLISTGSADLRYLASGASGQFYLASNPSGFITSSNLNGLLSTGSHSLINSITGISVSGGLGITGNFNINAGSNITLTQQGQNTLSISSAAGGGSSTNGVTGISITGGISISGAIGIVGAYGTNVIQSGNTIAISGGGGSSSSFTVTTWSNLTWGTTTTWSATPDIYEDRKILVITGNTTLSITNLYNGFVGVLQTIQSGVQQSSGGFGLNLPANTYVANAGSGIVNLTSGENSIDILGFAYDGSKLFCNPGNQFTRS